MVAGLSATKAIILKKSELWPNLGPIRLKTQYNSRDLKANGYDYLRFISELAKTKHIHDMVY